MCEVCRKSPCHPRCPNAGEPEARIKCEKCGHGIMEDEEYLEADGGPVCWWCLSDMSAREIVEVCGAMLQRA